MADNTENRDAGRRNGELKKRAYEYKLARVREAAPSRKIDTPELAYAYWREVVAGSAWHQENREHVVVLLLNTRHNIEGHALVAVGSINECVACPREILAPVLCACAYGFILMHDHPSGDPSPSGADRQLTRRIAEGAELLAVKFVDHVIAGRPDPGDPGREPYFSFREMGLL